MSAADPVHVVARAGGWATAQQILAVTTARRLRTAVTAGALVRLTRGVYACPGLHPEQAVAARLGGLVSHTSAARLLGLAMVAPPAQIHVTVPHGAARRERPDGVVVHQSRRWPDADADQGMTSPLRTVLDCAATLPYAEALAIADSALSYSWVHEAGLVEAARACAGAGRARRLRVAEAADGRADNPFESVLRAILHEAGLTTFEPQGQIWLGRRLIRPDLVDRDALLVIEADSYAHHGSPEDLARDCERYDTLTAAGWTVLRFTYRQVMGRPDWVVQTVLATRAELMRRLRSA